MPSEPELVVLTQRQPVNASAIVQDVLALSAEERQRSRFRGCTEAGTTVLLQLPRGTVLADGEVLTTDAQDWQVCVQAKAEPILRVEARTHLDLLRAAYHLGNRHVPLEVNETVLKLATDPVLQDMLERLGLQVTPAMEPFYPELGAYGHGH
ncbi:MAG TPA: urease accessory protein UreE [Stenomitos sp.]